jgi:hypothetical protein
MAPPTRSRPFQSLSLSPLAGKEATTIRRTRFYNALSNPKDKRSNRALCNDLGITEGCGRYWKKQYEALGSRALRTTRKNSTVLGAKSKVTKAICKKIVSPSNPVRKQPYEVQIKYHDIPVGVRQLQGKIKEHTKGGGRYLIAFVKKIISQKNRAGRTQYGEDHIYDALFGFYDHIVYTDEAHVDPTSQSQGRVSREKGTRDEPCNIEERPPLKGVRIHMAAWISWHGKADKLEFYNDEKDEEVEPEYPRHPSFRPTKETREEFAERVKIWEAGKPHKVNKQVQGNAMTQKYYVDRLLPIYIQAIESMREIDDKPWLLMEDGDPSHGMRKHGLAAELKARHNVQNITHPAQSPDLNPIEGVWAILKQRVRNRLFDSEEEMKEVLQEEWAKITMEEIRDRIADLPRRCAQLVKYGGRPVRGNKW